MSETKEMKELGIAFQIFSVTIIVSMIFNILSISIASIIIFTLGYALILTRISQVVKNRADKTLKKIGNYIMLNFIIALIFSFSVEIFISFTESLDSTIQYLILISLTNLQYLFQGLFYLLISQKMEIYAIDTLNNPKLLEISKFMRKGAILMMIPLISLLGVFGVIVQLIKVGIVLITTTQNQNQPNQDQNQNFQIVCGACGIVNKGKNNQCSGCGKQLDS